MIKRINYLIGIVLLALLVGSLFLYFSGREKTDTLENSGKEKLAHCLEGKGVRIYTIASCPHCVRQKEIFGSAFSKMEHVDCSKLSSACTDAGINQVPTWVFPQELEIDKKLLSCKECREQNNGVFCRETCYTFIDEKNEFRITGFMELKELSNVTNCLF